MLPVNVLNIRMLSVPAPVMTITLNVMPPSGVKTTDTTRLLVLCPLTLMKNVLMIILFIKNVKKIREEPAVNKDMSILVLRGGYMRLQTAARGILLTVNAVPHRPLPDVRLTTALTVPVRPPVPMPADIPVTAVAMTIVRPERLKTIPVPYLLIPNAEPPVSVAKIVLPAVRLIPVLMSGLPNAGLVMLVPTPAERVLNLSLALRPKTRFGFLLPNAAPAVMNVNITQIVP